MNAGWYVLIGLILVFLFSILLFRFWLEKKKKQVMMIPPNGINETETVTIGEIPQFFCHRGNHLDRPVLLFLHGGPGHSMIPFLHGFQRQWEEDLIVVHYDQRSAGKTLLANHPSTIFTTNTFSQALLDLHEVVNHLKGKYPNQPILFMGYSYGAYLGHHYIKQYPNDISAFFSVSPLVDALKSDESQYLQFLEYCTKEHKQEGLTKAIALEPFPSLPFDEEYIRKFNALRQLQHQYHVLPGMKPQYLMLLLTSPYLSFDEYQGTQTSMANQSQFFLHQYLHEHSLLSQEETVYIPYYCLLGDQDFECPTELSIQFFERLQAPKKSLHRFSHLGHTPFLENPTAFYEAFSSMLQDWRSNHQ